ncbi:MAG: sugar ABC transporter permease [Deltaproteobacteria bacterium]|nr:sugar ABC transporter permease [Deltaproteobacteria bacterium]MBW1923590.1 sugar ABC transporter permease [Deltaproteobacteria bacterium]MBW1948582.1 sugar ABC transporter permease [Deltaproteobacteria bacterium]MBW2006742.1 sugar ABC transporter permease [Deltaproteobacteria bacterium]MBW2349148.1 sugar ABC transporter permease [Deltaproteobacteria bacterium]
MGLKTLQERESRLALYMLAPALVIVLLLVFFPTAWNIWLSLKPVSLEGLRGEGLWNAGLTLRNYQKVLSDPELPGVAATTLAYTVGGSLFSILLGLTAALLVHKEFPGRAFIRGLLISPYIAPIVAVAFTWSFILDPQLGCLNWLGVKTGVLDQPVAFFSARWIQVRLPGFTMPIPLALLSVIFFEGWRYFPFALLFILARLQAIPEDLYRAAAVDGAGPFQRFFHITLPQLRSVLATLFLFRFIWTLNKFDDIFLLTGGEAGTRVLTLKVYDYAFGAFDIGAGSAAAMLLFFILGIFMAGYLRWVTRQEVR